MKKITLLFLLFTIGATAQVVTIGTGTSVNYKGPITSFWDYGATEMIYLGSEINTTGNITSIGWYVSTASTLPCNPVYIYMKTTSATTLATSTAGYPATTAGYTLVYTGTGHDDQTGWQSIELDTPFPFTDASQNLSILAVNLTGDYFEQYPEYRYTLTTGSYRCATYYSNTLWQSGVSNLTPTYERYNVQIGIAAVTNPPSIASFSPDNGCAGDGTVTITGTNFTGATEVKIGSADVASFTVDSSTQITATLGNNVITGAVSVTTADGTATSAGSFTINNPAAPTVLTSTQQVCPEATLLDIDITGSNIQWYANDTDDVALPENTVLANGIVYYASQTDNGCESIGRTPVTIEVNVVDAPTATPLQSFCPESTVGSLAANGSGIKWYTDETAGQALMDDAVLDNGLYYASQTIDGCESPLRTEVTVQITVVDAPEALGLQTFCSADSTVASLSATGSGIKWYAANEGGEPIADGTLLEDGVSYFASQTVGECESTLRTEVVAVINVVDAPTGQAVQVIEVNSAEEATLEDLQVVVDGIGTVTWYASAEDAETGDNPLSETTQLIAGENYFATFTEGICTSASSFEVTANVVLGTEVFHDAAFSYYPNPVKDMLTLTYPSDITSVSVHNLLGQQVMTQQVNAPQGNVDMSGLADGTYIVKITAGNLVKAIRVIKK